MAHEIYPPIERRSERHAIALSARLSPIEPDPSASPLDKARGAICVRTVDLCDGGLAVQTAQPVQRDSRVVVQVDLPDGRTFCCAGRVAWAHERGSDPALLGIAFDAPSLELARQELVCAEPPLRVGT